MPEAITNIVPESDPMTAMAQDPMTANGMVQQQQVAATGLVPDAYGELLDILSIPIAWVPDFMHAAFGFVFQFDGWLAALGYLLLLLPVVMVVVGVWTTQLSIYTLPFRSGR